MDDPVPVALKRRAEGRHPFFKQTATGFIGLAGERGKHQVNLSVAKGGLTHPISDSLKIGTRRAPSCRFLGIAYIELTPIAKGQKMTLNLPPQVTDRAFARLAEIAEISGEVKSLRVAVDGGGCSGFQYDIRLDDPAADDVILEKDGMKVLIDTVSLPFLANAVIDFSEEVIGARFVIQNPNASSSCGCGISFSM